MSRADVIRDIDGIVQRWKAKKATLRGLVGEYHVSYRVLVAELRRVMPDYDQVADRFLPLLTVRKFRRKDCKMNGRWRRFYQRFIKIGMARPGRAGNWMPYSRYLWEQAHGPVPEGYRVRHLDGDRLNDDIGNLALVSNADNARIATAKCDKFKRNAATSATRRAMFEAERRIAEVRRAKQQAIAATRKDESWSTDWDDDEEAA